MPHPSLLRLPTELLDLVIENADCSTRASIARTCRALNAIATPHLYRRAEIKRGKSNEFIHTISEKYANLVCHLTVESRESGISPGRITPCLDKLENLESLGLHWFRDADESGQDKWSTFHKLLGKYFARASLDQPIHSRVSPNLRSYCLRILTPRIVTLGRFEKNAKPAAFIEGDTGFFVMPQLHELTLRGFMFHENDSWFNEAHERKTELKSLRFERCWVSFNGLEAVLMAPRALQYLHIGHVKAFTPDTYGNDASLDEFMSCLISHRDSLKGIKIVHESPDGTQEDVTINDPSFQTCADQLPQLERWEGCDESSLERFLVCLGEAGYIEP